MTRRIGPFRALEHNFEIAAPTDIAELFAECLGDLIVEGPVESSLRIRRRGTKWALETEQGQRHWGSLGHTVAHVLERMNSAAAHSTEGIALHAASVLTPGGVVGFVGHSGAGKSTLAAACVRAGLGYVADEVTAVSPWELVADPYHRPIGLRRDGARALGIEYPDSPDGRFALVYPWRVGGRGHLAASGPLLGLAFVSHSEEGSEPVELRPAHALARLVTHVLGATGRERELFWIANDLVRRIPVVELIYSSPEHGVQMVTELARGWVP